ncbi:hypothetical protein PO878_15660 [Iamia majanohamensis]|uniref:Lipoprotein n=1 Tax=Iamia majanohamensis TaxID=467976 RepID=A0AAE9Y7W5_9ACTN|nr:hypothetical protein [Iamia majanohamensis]WCO65939.1 hypothetical protein PO878_15660 [Iamia majanohamensis]
MPRRPRRPARPSGLLLALALAVALVAAACGGASDVDQETFQADLLERVNTPAAEAGQPEPLPEDVAGCITERVYDEYDQGEVNRIYRAATPTELDEDVRDQLTLINQDCYEELGPPVAEEGDGSAPTTTEAGDGSTTTEAPDDTTTTEAG